MVLRRELSPMELFVETHVRSDDRKKRVQQFTNNRAQHFVVCWFSIIFLLSYNFLQFDEFLFLDIYNNLLKERYEDNPSTHSDLDPDLWFEVRSFIRLNRNWVCRLSNTT